MYLNQTVIDYLKSILVWITDAVDDRIPNWFSIQTLRLHSVSSCSNFGKPVQFLNAKKSESELGQYIEGQRPFGLIQFGLVDQKSVQKPNYLPFGFWRCSDLLFSFWAFTALTVLSNFGRKLSWGLICSNIAHPRFKYVSQSSSNSI